MLLLLLLLLLLPLLLLRLLLLLLRLLLRLLRLLQTPLELKGGAHLLSGALSPRTCKLAGAHLVSPH